MPSLPLMPSLKDVRVLVTGAGGFIGSHLVERLVHDGAKVRAFVRYTSRADIGLLKLAPAEVRSGIEVTHGDLRDEHAVHEAVRDVEIVFHLGALIAIPYSYVHPREVVRNQRDGHAECADGRPRTRGGAIGDDVNE